MSNDSEEGRQSGRISPFDAIRRVDEDGNEYWSARELYKLLGYSTWQRFQHAIEQAKKACQESNQAIEDHFNIDVKIVKAGTTTKPREDYKLAGKLADARKERPGAAARRAKTHRGGATTLALRST